MGVASPKSIHITMYFYLCKVLILDLINFEKYFQNKSEEYTWLVKFYIWLVKFMLF